MNQPQIQSFGSFDEMLEVMAANEKAALEAMHPGQKAIQPGAKVLRAVDMGGEIILIVGQTFDAEEHIRREREATGPEDGPVDPDYCRRQIEGLNDRGLLMGEFFSVIEPRGELGSINKVTITMELPDELYYAILKLIQMAAR